MNVHTSAPAAPPRRGFVRILPLAALLLAGVPLGAAAQSAPGIDNVDWRRNDAPYSADALRAFNDVVAKLGTAWREADARRISELYSVGAAVVFADGELIRGRDAVLRVLSERMPRDWDLRLSATDFVSTADLLSATGPFVLERADGEVVTGNFAMVLRMEGGRWRIRSQLFTPSLPLSPLQNDSVGQ